MPEMPLPEMRTLNCKARFKDHRHYLTISTRTRPIKHIHHHERTHQLHAKDCIAGWSPICFGSLPYPQGTVCSGKCSSICKTIDLSSSRRRSPTYRLIAEFTLKPSFFHSFCLPTGNVQLQLQKGLPLGFWHVPLDGGLGYRRFLHCRHVG
jgi:hypothetical protein